MRILLIQAPSVEGVSSERVYPIGIVSLATLLGEHHHETSVFDMNITPNPWTGLRERLLEFRPDVVGISLRNIDPLGNKTVSLVPPFVATVRLTAAVLPDAWIVAGGTAFSLFPERLMREVPELDFGIVGEAEHSLPALLASLENPGPIQGLCSRHTGGITVQPPSRGFDMNSYLPPDRRLLDPAAYLGINSYAPAIGIETKRGCPYRCAYCVYPTLQGRRVRFRPPSSVVDEMERLHKEHGVENFHFTDPVVNSSGCHLEEISREILRRRLKVRWDGFFREDRFDEQNAALFANAGCECFSFSPDGLCQESLDTLEKGLSESDIIKAARAAAETEVMSVYHFLVNVPGETAETCEKSIGFLERMYAIHAKKRNLGTVVLNNIRILPGTNIERIARKQGLVTAETDLIYPFYYNPMPYDTVRYRLETLHLCRNVFMWQDMEI
jgi:putative variant cofactor biosynthesis B12-binding/radical SAM domain protein 1